MQLENDLKLIVDLIKDWWDSKLPESGVISWLSVIPKVLLAGAITLMDELYYKLAVWLNDQGWSLFNPMIRE